jgi:hypothetical protein
MNGILYTDDNGGNNVMAPARQELDHKRLHNIFAWKPAGFFAFAIISLLGCFPARLWKTLPLTSDELNTTNMQLIHSFTQSNWILYTRAGDKRLRHQAPLSWHHDTQTTPWQADRKKIWNYPLMEQHKEAHWFADPSIGPAKVTIWCKREIAVTAGIQFCPGLPSSPASFFQWYPHRLSAEILPWPLGASHFGAERKTS